MQVLEKLLVQWHYIHRKNMATENMKQEVVTQTIHAIPSGALLGTVLANITITQWQAGFAIGFIFLQTAYLLWKWIREFHQDRK